MTRLTYVINTTGSDHFGHYLAPVHVDCEKYIRVEREG